MLLTHKRRKTSFYYEEYGWKRAQKVCGGIFREYVAPEITPRTRTEF